MAEEYDPAQEIGFEGDEEAPAAHRHHIFDAAAHQAGHAPHPGKPKQPRHTIREHPDQLDRPVPTESDLARLREEMEYGEQLGAQQGQKPPVPPEEALPPQPPLSGGKGKEAKPPSAGTPTAIGQATVAPPPPAGEF